MRKSVQRSLVGLVVLVALLALASPAFALPFSFTEKQTVPGVTEHTIWAENQIAIYKLPHNVTHVGDIHVTVTFDSNNVDYDLYVIDENGTRLNEGSGSQQVLDGGNMEVVDATVTNIVHTNRVNVGTDKENIQGDPYWVIVVVYGGSGKFELSGYYPRLDPSSGWSTLDPWDWFIKQLKPITGSLQGAPYGGPWDFKATSRGLVKLSFQWPANVKTHVVSDDLQKGLQPVQFCEDLYRDPNWGAMPVSRYGSICWHGNHYAGPPEWWGLYDQFLATDFSLPYSYHYVPYIYGAAADPTLGELSTPKTGVTTVGYKATVLIPQNLTIDRSTATVKAGGSVAVTGRFALDGAWKSGAQVTLLKQSGKKWVKLATGTTAASGKWTIKVKPTGNMIVKAMATGDAATGIPVEYSLVKAIKVR